MRIGPILFVDNGVLFSKLKATSTTRCNYYDGSGEKDRACCWGVGKTSEIIYKKKVDETNLQNFVN